MIDDDVWHSLRVLHFRQGKSKKWIAEEFGLSRNTVAKYLEHPEPPEYRIRQPRARPVASKWEEHVRLILAEDQDAPRKQKHTSKRIFDRLVIEQGYAGSERTIRSLVSSLRSNASSRAFVPLMFAPGKDAQVDFGESYVDLDGVRTKLYGFEMRLNYSRRKFQMYFRSPNMESFLEAHVRAFQFFGGVPERISYDNLGLAVVRVGKGRDRTLTKSFKRLMGYYSFSANFCTPGKQGAHEKGGVESGIGYSRRNWMVPVPRCASLDELNEGLVEKCVADGCRTVAGQSQSIDEAFAAECPLLLALPPAPFDSGVRKSACCVDSYQTVIFDRNRYSVPTKFVGKPLSFRAYWDRVQISSGSEVVVEHPRSYSEGEYILLPEHYFDLLERRPQAVAYARPLLHAQWPPAYWQCYKDMSATLGLSRAGKDFVRILRCHAQYGSDRTVAAIEEARIAGALNADVIVQILDRARLTPMLVEPLDVSDRPELASVTVALLETSEYQKLLGETDDQHVA